MYIMLFVDLIGVGKLEPQSFFKTGELSERPSRISR